MRALGQAGSTYSPSELMTSRTMRTPEFLLPPRKQVTEWVQKEVWIADLVQTIEEIWAQENQQRQREEQRTSGYQWKIGDKVILKELTDPWKQGISCGTCFALSSVGSSVMWLLDHHPSVPQERRPKIVIKQFQQQ
ncbi:unnamed protein product [Natator depressus]